MSHGLQEVSHSWTGAGAHGIASVPDKIVIFGGLAGGGADRQPDAWIFDGTTWTLLNANGEPGARVYVGMTFDGARNTMLLKVHLLPHRQSLELSKLGMKVRVGEVSGGSFEMK